MTEIALWLLGVLFFALWTAGVYRLAYHHGRFDEVQDRIRRLKDVRRYQATRSF